jgi:E3 ubiquitin-protein ligase HECTD1
VIKEKVFEGQKVYAMVAATDVNGACSGKGVSACVVLPDRFGPLVLSLQYDDDFDQNGLLYYIGSAGGTRGYVNPHVVVTWSSIGIGGLLGGRREYFVNNRFNNLNCFTSNQAGSWMMVDLGATRRISPNHYSLRHDRGLDGYLRNWVLEGKMDDSDTSAWVVLREHVNDASINGAGATCSWPVTSAGIAQSYRYIRIRMTGVGSNGSHYLRCSGIELYGDLHISS